MKLREFLNNWWIDSSPPKTFSDAEEWQKKRLLKKEDWFNYLAGFEPKPQWPRFWLEVAPRGHDKTSHIGRVLIWFLLFCRNKHAVVAAADADQAAIVKARMLSECKLNKLDSLIFQSKKILCQETESSVSIISADAPSAYGRLDDLIIMDELTHWPSQDLFVTLFSGAIKRPDCLVMILTNAGYVGTWQYDLYMKAKEGNWEVTELPFSASWMKPKDIEVFLPWIEARRLLYNEWVSTVGGFLAEDISSCIVEKVPEPEFPVVISLDYGPKHDRTVACVASGSYNISVHEMEIWEGSSEEPVSLDLILSWLISTYVKYSNYSPIIVIDPYQTLSIIQALKRYSIPCCEFSFSTNNITAMLTTLRTYIESKKIKIPKGCGRSKDGTTLTDELLQVSIVKSNWTYKLHSKTHDDRVVALGMACLYLTRETLVHSPFIPPLTGQLALSPRVMYGVPVSFNSLPINKLEKEQE